MPHVPLKYKCIHRYRRVINLHLSRPIGLYRPKAVVVQNLNRIKSLKPLPNLL